MLMMLLQEDYTLALGAIASRLDAIGKTLIQIKNFSETLVLLSLVLFFVLWIASRRRNH